MTRDEAQAEGPGEASREALDARTVDTVVVGAGIAGLACAADLARADRDVVVLEATDHLGGAIETRRRETAAGTYRFETGPNTVLGRPAVLELIDDLGLGERVVRARDEAKRRYVLADGRLQPLPTGPLAFLTTGLFSLRAKLGLLGEPWGKAPEGRSDDAIRDESIASFVRRRLGEEILDRAVGPFVSGVWAGDPERLAVGWTVERLARLEREHGSLVRGALARMRQRRRERTGRGKTKTTSSAGPAGPRGTLISFDDGLEVLPRALAEVVVERLGPEHLRLATPARTVRAIEGRDGARFEIEAGDEALRCRSLVLTGGPGATARLLEELTAGASSPLAEIPMAPVAVVTLGLERAAVAHPLDGFGYLRALDEPTEGAEILGCLFPASIFPDRAPEGRVLLTVFVGGRRFPEAVDLDDDELLARVRRELHRALGLDPEATPELLHVRRWPRAIPQTEAGHGRFVDLAQDLEQAHPGLVVAGSFLGGVSVPDRIARGRGVGRRLAGG